MKRYSLESKLNREESENSREPVNAENTEQPVEWR